MMYSIIVIDFNDIANMHGLELVSSAYAHVVKQDGRVIEKFSTLVDLAGWLFTQFGGQ